MRRLKRHGLSFERAFTNACMCSPARSTLMSGYLPAQHGVKYTLESDMPADQYPQVELPTDLPNLATVMSAAGYNVVYKGKWHCSKPAGRRGRSRRPRRVRLRPLEPAGRRRQPGHLRGRRRQHEQRRPHHGLRRRHGRRHRGSAPVPRLNGRPAAAVLHGDLARQPPRRPLLPEVLRRRRLRRLLARRRHRHPGDQRRGPLDQADGPGAVQEDLRPDRQAEDPGAEAQLPQLLRQPDALLRRLPRPTSSTSSRRPACSTTR